MESATKPPMWYWIISVLAVIWMLTGAMAWIMDLIISQDALSQMSEPQRQLYLSRPLWLLIVYALAVFSGLAGAVGLLLRKPWAEALFLISIASAIVQFGYTFIAMDAIRLLGAETALPVPAAIFSIGLFLVWLSIHAKKSGWFVS